MPTRNSTPFPVLKTERLTLRRLAIQDDQEIFTLRTDRKINKYLGRQIANNIEDARTFINRMNENIDNNDSFYWAITLKDQSTLVGTICLYGFSDDHRSCEIGYELLTNFQGQGIMKEALEKVIDYAFHTMNVQRIEAYFHHDNTGSRRLLEKLSFRASNHPGNTPDPDLLHYHLEQGSLS